MYRRVFVYDEEGEFLGYGIKQDRANGLQTTHLYQEAEMDNLWRQLERLNEADALRSVWPDARDPEVQALLADESWEPVQTAMMEVIDEEESTLVYGEEWATDRTGAELLGDDGRPVMTQGDLLPDLSTIVYKTVEAPRSPAEVGQRIQKAQELVAKRRVVFGRSN